VKKAERTAAESRAPTTVTTNKVRYEPYTYGHVRIQDREPSATNWGGETHLTKKVPNQVLFQQKAFDQIPWIGKGNHSAGD
jgi:hypothetical protein